MTNQSTISAVDIQTLILQIDPRRRTILPGKIETRIQWFEDINADQDSQKASKGDFHITIVLHHDQRT
jgi:hypothetical protein